MTDISHASGSEDATGQEHPVGVLATPATTAVKQSSDSTAHSDAAVAGVVDASSGSQWDLATKRTVVVIMLVGAVIAVWISRQIIPLLVASGILAYIFSPLVDLLERIRIPRAVSTLTLYVLLVLGLTITPFLVLPVLVNQLASLSFDVPTTAIQLWAWLGNAITTLPSRIEILGFEIPLEGVTQQIESSFTEFTFIPTLAEFLNYIQQLISTATNVMSSTAAIGFSVVGGLFNALIAVLVIFFLSLYLTKDAPVIRAYVESLFPQSYQSEWADLLRRMGYIWQAFFRGQILLCIIIGVSTALALELAGMPGALVLGLLAAVLEVIPNLGPIIAMIPAVIIALIQGSSVLGEYGVNNFGFALITVAIYFLIQQLEAYILVPRIIGGNVRLHPVVVVAGVAIGYNIGGIFGAFFAAPVIATLRVLGGYIHAKLLDREPFLDQPLPKRKRRSTYTYRRTVTGEQLAAQSDPLDTPVGAAPAYPPPALMTSAAMSSTPRDSAEIEQAADSHGADHDHSPASASTSASSAASASAAPSTLREERTLDDRPLGSGAG